MVFLVNILNIFINGVDCKSATEYDDDRQNSETTDRLSFLIFAGLVPIYGPFGSKTFLFGSSNNSGNIRLLEK